MIIDISLDIGRMKFADALKATKYGDTIIYHVGGYAGGKHKHDALAASAGGLVALVQKKLGKSHFQYLAQRSKKKFGS